MKVVDTSVLIAILEREDQAQELLKILESESAVMMSTVSYTEAGIVATSRRGDSGRRALERLVKALNIEIVACDQTQSELAIDAFQKYGKGRHSARLNFGDCFSYALAKHLNLPLLFVGNDFERTDIV